MTIDAALLAQILGLEEAPRLDPYWTNEELMDALALSIARHVSAGWKWEPPFLIKGHIKARPTALMRARTPADRDFNPTKDAFALRMGARYLGNYRYELQGKPMHHDGTFLDPDACPECGGDPWMVQVRDVMDRRAVKLPQVLVACSRCVSGEELEEKSKREDLFGNKVAHDKRKSRTR